MKALLSVVVGLAMVAGALGQDEKKKDDVAPVLDLKSSKDLKPLIGWTDEQCKKCDAIYTEYKDKAAEAQKKLKDAEDKKAAGKDLRTLRAEIVGKIREICTDDEQKKKCDEANAPKKKKAQN